MARYIPIQKDKIPYSFDISLSGRTYTLNLKYNTYSDDFTTDLLLGEKVLVEGKKLILGQPIFEEFAYDNNGNKDEDYFDELLVPYDLTWQEKEINLENFADNVQIYVMERD